MNQNFFRFRKYIRRKFDLRLYRESSTGFNSNPTDELPTDEKQKNLVDEIDKKVVKEYSEINFINHPLVPQIGIEIRAMRPVASAVFLVD